MSTTILSKYGWKIDSERGQLKTKVRRSRERAEEEVKREKKGKV
jgi:hypothetical protein